jgi:Ni2+-binding GTPase involved in regulation of expression and maturation of urease and hydrogenase
MLLNKVDLLPYVSFNTKKAAQFARHLNKDLQIFEISCTSGEGLNDWYAWLRAARKTKI